jgi:hypothetical protein
MLLRERDGILPRLKHGPPRSVQIDDRKTYGRIAAPAGQENIPVSRIISIYSAYGKLV